MLLETRNCKRQHTVSLIDVGLPESLDRVETAVAQRGSQTIFANQACLTADVGQVSALVQRGQMLKMDLHTESVGDEDFFTMDALVLGAVVEGISMQW